MDNLEQSPLSKAMSVLKEKLETGMDYRRGWIDNISSCFQDEYELSRDKGYSIKQISDKAVERFINILTL